jgi:hypothetical protein
MVEAEVDDTYSLLGVYTGTTVDDFMAQIYGTWEF